MYTHISPGYSRVRDRSLFVGMGSNRTVGGGGARKVLSLRKKKAGAGGKRNH